MERKVSGGLNLDSINLSFVVVGGVIVIVK